MNAENASDEQPYGPTSPPSSGMRPMYSSERPQQTASIASNAALWLAGLGSEASARPFCTRADRYAVRDTAELTPRKSKLPRSSAGAPPATTSFFPAMSYSVFSVSVDW